VERSLGAVWRRRLQRRADHRAWALALGPPGQAGAPLLRGFATYGTDSGRQNAPGVRLQAFALNDEALINVTLPRTRRCATWRSS
jgi:hypothetical protein